MDRPFLVILSLALLALHISSVTALPTPGCFSSLLARCVNNIKTDDDSVLPTFQRTPPGNSESTRIPVAPPVLEHFETEYAFVMMAVQSNPTTEKVQEVINFLTLRPVSDIPRFSWVVDFHKERDKLCSEFIYNKFKRYLPTCDLSISNQQVLDRLRSNIRYRYDEPRGRFTLPMTSPRSFNLRTDLQRLGKTNLVTIGDFIDAITFVLENFFLHQKGGVIPKEFLPWGMDLENNLVNIINHIYESIKHCGPCNPFDVEWSQLLKMQFHAANLMTEDYFGEGDRRMGANMVLAIDKVIDWIKTAESKQRKMAGPTQASTSTVTHRISQPECVPDERKMVGPTQAKTGIETDENDWIKRAKSQKQKVAGPIQASTSAVTDKISRPEYMPDEREMVGLTQAKTRIDTDEKLWLRHSLEKRIGKMVVSTSKKDAKASANIAVNKILQDFELLGMRVGDRVEPTSMRDAELEKACKERDEMRKELLLLRQRVYQAETELNDVTSQSRRLNSIEGEQEGKESGGSPEALDNVGDLETSEEHKGKAQKFKAPEEHEG